MRLCGHCRQLVPDDAKICPECGSKIACHFPSYTVDLSSEQGENKKKNTGWVVAIVAIMTAFCVILPVIGGIFAYQFLQENIFMLDTNADTVEKLPEYANAMELMENQQYEEALDAFLALENFFDSPAKAAACAYALANQCLDRGELVAALEYKDYLTEELKSEIYSRYYSIFQEKAAYIIMDSLDDNLDETLDHTTELPYDTAHRCHYMVVYNNTIFPYTLLYQINYYDQAGNQIHQSEELEYEMYRAFHNRVPMPLDNSMDWATIKVDYRIKITERNIDNRAVCAVRLLDEDGNPLDNATIGWKHLASTLNTTDSNGVAAVHTGKKVERFQMYVSGHVGFNFVEEVYDIPADGWVHDVVVRRDTPDFSVTVVDAQGNPIAGATMSLTTADVWSASSKYGKTDENGYVCWYDVDLKHTYKLRSVDKFGYKTVTDIYFEPGENHLIIVLEEE